MDRRFIGCLGCTGLAAIVVLLFPAAALIGFMMGILPGIFLGAAPSLFFYLIAWWGVRWLALKIETAAGFDPNMPLVRWVANFVAIGIVLAVTVIVPRTVNAPLEQEVAELQATDVASGPVKLPAIVAVILPKFYSMTGDAPHCEAICLRLLYNGVVSRVIAAEIGYSGKIETAASYHIERRDQCPNPNLRDSLVVWPGEIRAEGGVRPAGPLDRVRARISAGECLIRGTGRIEDADAVISFREMKKGASKFSGPWKLRLDTASARRLEVTEADGRVLYRRTEVTAEPLSVPLHSVAAAGFFTTVTYAGWARNEIEHSPIGPQGRDVLPGLLGEASRTPDPPDATRL
jgi:hypothetical protein